MMSLFHLAHKNLKLKTFRTSALIVSIALVSGLLFAGSISMKSVLKSVKVGAERLGADIMVVPEGYEEKARSTLIAGKPSVFYMPGEIFDKVRKIKGVKQASPQLFIKSLPYPCCSIVDVLLVAFDPESDFTVKPWLQETIKRKLSRDEIIIGASIPVSKDEKMTFYGKELTVVGKLSKTGLEYIDHAAYMTMETARELIRVSKIKAYEPLNIKDDVYSAILVQLDPGISPERAALFIEYEIKGIKAITSQEVMLSVKRQLSVLMRTLFGIAISLWIVTIILVGVIFSMIVNERKREIGILRSLGAKRSEVFYLITIEAFIISLIGGITGILSGGLIILAIKEPIRVAFNLPYLWPDALFVLAVGIVILLISLLTGTGTALFPALRISRMEPYEAIRMGE
ncbi:MAG: FtsX-like permease family protein [Thermodesulfovibrionales bacterium]|nr:FtsX-like permease family protein [Thermodesulfovibrionales bacterium]